MQIAVLSGKGGTGKTFVSTNLAAVIENSTYLDCDVEEPDGRLLLHPVSIQTEKVTKPMPQVNADKCIGCRACVDICRFGALAFLGGKPMVFPEVCHSCGGCTLVCPTKAMEAHPHEIGTIETGTSGNMEVVTGILSIGEASAVPLISAVLKKAKGNTIIDCPPGSACSVMESIKGSDYCVMVAEPTIFGLHNLNMVYTLVKLFHKPYGIVINKCEDDYNLIDDFCKKEHIEVLLRIPFDKQTAQDTARGKLAVRQNAAMKQSFMSLADKLRERTKK
ncbi:MAG: ATP-binding protein [Spirochaetia bacterium]|jgi:MinD superfamily P-loop ATPase|nr:ATP-binding protein [Spirochaetia bacterium]